MKNKTIAIKKLKSAKELKECFEIMQELRTHIDYKKFVKSVNEIQNYKLFGLYRGKDIVCVAGIAIFTIPYFGRHLWVHDLVTKNSERSKGYGKQMMLFLQDFARKNKCGNVTLTSGLQRAEAHKFYERLGMEKKSYVFMKGIKN